MNIFNTAITMAAIANFRINLYLSSDMIKTVTIVFGIVKTGNILQAAIESLKPPNEIQLVTCSRTDSGVHALCNAAHVDIEKRNPEFPSYLPDNVTQRLNKNLIDNNEDIRY